MEEYSIIKKIEYYCRTNNLISFAQGYPFWKPPRKIVDFMYNQIKNGKANSYNLNSGLIELRKKLANYLNKKRNTNLTEKNIIITLGAINGISNLLSILDKGNIITYDPSYVSYDNLIKFKGFNNIKINNLDEINNYNAKVILLTNPNNPTGEIFSLDEISKIKKDSQKFIIIDEVYSDLTFKKFESGIKILDKNIAIVNSWSKILGITGRRIGYVVASEEIINKLSFVNECEINCPPVHTQRAIYKGLDIIDNFINYIKNKLKIRKNYIINNLKTDKITIYNSDATYYLRCKFNYTDNDIEECNKILNTIGVGLVPGSYFGKSGKGYFRLCYSRNLKDIKKGINLLKEYFSNI